METENADLPKTAMIVIGMFQQITPFNGKKQGFSIRIITWKLVHDPYFPCIF